MNGQTPRKSISAIPLNALRAFEVTARHMSMKDAAGELNVTPSAISHRLRLLENILGCRLFRREGTRLRLTDCGRALAPALTEGFDRIIAALGTVQPGAAKRGLGERQRALGELGERQRSLSERQRSLSERNGHARLHRDRHAIRVAPTGCER